MTGAAGQINGTIARKKKRLRFPESPDGRSIAYNFESLDINATERKLNAFYAEFEPISSEKEKPHQHPGVKLLYLLSGKLDLTIGSETFNLESGDAAYFDSGVRHSYHRSCKSSCNGVPDIQFVSYVRSCEKIPPSVVRIAFNRIYAGDINCSDAAAGRTPSRNTSKGSLAIPIDALL